MITSIISHTSSLIFQTSKEARKISSHLEAKVALIALVILSALSALFFFYYHYYKKEKLQIEEPIDSKTNKVLDNQLSYESSSSSSSSTEENFFYQNPENLSGDLVAEIPKDYLFVSDNHYAFDIRELFEYFEITTKGLLKNPYTGEFFSVEDQEKLKKLPIYGQKITQVSEIKLNLDHSSISKKTIIELLWLALALGVDYPERYFDTSHIAHFVSQCFGKTHHMEVELTSKKGEANVYLLSNQAVICFASYLENISHKEKEMLQNTIIEWKVDKNIQRVRFQDKFESLLKGEECVHKAAVFFWACAQTLNPKMVTAIPGPIDFTNNYWGKMIQIDPKIEVEEVKNYTPKLELLT